MVNVLEPIREVVLSLTFPDVASRGSKFKMAEREIMIGGRRLSQLKVDELKVELERRGLRKSGNKGILIERLQEVVLFVLCARSLSNWYCRLNGFLCCIILHFKFVHCLCFYQIPGKQLFVWLETSYLLLLTSFTVKL